jgi:AmiR/NasT family two-component response regulator
VAQGILMQRFHIDMDTALEVLRRYSSHTNVKMREIAQLVVDERRLPEIGLPDAAGSDA